MSFPFHGDLDFEIHTAPPPPATARELVDEQGIEAVREALPAADRHAFDQANPWRNIERASERLAERVEELNAFDQDLEDHIATQGYDGAQAQVVYEQTANLRQPLAEAVVQAERRASGRLDTYRENLIAHIENRGLTERVAVETGNYSMPERNVAAAAWQYQPPGNNRHDRGGGGPGAGGESAVMRESRAGGNRQSGRR